MKKRSLHSFMLKGDRAAMQEHDRRAVNRNAKRLQRVLAKRGIMGISLVILGAVLFAVF